MKFSTNEEIKNEKLIHFYFQEELAKREEYRDLIDEGYVPYYKYVPDKERRNVLKELKKREGVLAYHPNIKNIPTYIDIFRDEKPLEILIKDSVCPGLNIFFIKGNSYRR